MLNLVQVLTKLFGIIVQANVSLLFELAITPVHREIEVHLGKTQIQGNRENLRKIEWFLAIGRAKRGAFQSFGVRLAK